MIFNFYKNFSNTNSDSVNSVSEVSPQMTTSEQVNILSQLQEMQLPCRARQQLSEWCNILRAPPPPPFRECRELLDYDAMLNIIIIMSRAGL